jgi:CheY-like chemotaxis protein
MQAVKILLAEDDPGHARLIERNLRRSGLRNELVMVNNGQRVIDYLKKNACDQAGHECLVIVLDLNLPVLDGAQVLERIKANPQTQKIPVVVLTTTDMPQEIAKCYELGCNLFITKPVQYDEFCSVIHNLGLLLSVIKVP